MIGFMSNYKNLNRLAFVAKLYLSPHFPRLKAIKSISVTRLLVNYQNKSRFLDFFVLLGKVISKSSINHRRYVKEHSFTQIMTIQNRNDLNMFTGILKGM